MKYIVMTLEYAGLGRIEKESYNFNNESEAIKKYKELKEKNISNVSLYKKVHVNDNKK